MNKPPVNELQANELQRLLESAEVFFANMASAYQEALPQDAAAFATLAIAGGAVPSVRLAFPVATDPSVELGYVHNGEFVPFFSSRQEVNPMDMN